MNSEDRRSHIRIHDQVLLAWRPITREAFEGIMQAFREGRTTPWSECTRAYEFPKIDAPLKRLREKDPALAAVVEILDQKLTMLLNRLARPEEDECEAKPHLVDISGVGIAFQSDEAIPVGQVLEMDLGLLPSHTFMRLYGEVLRCDRESGGAPYAVAVKFIWIAEDDLDRLIEHIFQRQVLQLRLRRQQQEAD
ncbi:PilZ domain-containing protein [Dissulfurirhabdus thermomarina]|uniref:PilZ domain-containing protein n=1 Tax=Dissulfurirhabdus thermomarina TaxID=1765737 RepID=A0A6N9TL80_DISTH|nr:PilZ domain-containing protein [Dissulfurirhabdus thermomarina]NDY42032.1 PilZ domain-containing protein [Dissulfurirhabdus thermomarina]NMX23057.1 PilZ domain-containing protein [Dissulfurirhabdus thermomarina]